MKYIKYSKHNDSDPIRRLAAKNVIQLFGIAIMKFTAAIYAEVVLTLMISKTNEIDDIIKDFVALGFIVEIDNQFATNLKGYKVQEMIDNFR